MSESVAADSSLRSFRRDRDFWNNRAREHGYKACGYLTSYQRWEEMLRQDTFIKRIGITKGMKILDIGSGNGSWCRWLASKGGCVTGIDISEGMVQLAAGNNSESIDYRCLPIEDADFPQDYFDLIISITVLQHITDSQRLLKAISNIKRMLKPGARFVAMEFSPVTKRENIYDTDHMLYHTVGEWEDIFFSCGFPTVSKIGVRFISHRVYHRFHRFINNERHLYIARAFERPLMRASIFIDKFLQHIPVRLVQDLSDFHLFILAKA